ncbi:MAG: N-acetyl-alpha-D-glucosaminyl L-malate synthase BshA [Calditrichota bacterium]
MKIGIICYPTYGGSGVVATELGLALAERGHEIHFFSTARPFRLGAFRPGVYFHEVPVVHYSLFEHTPYTLTLSSTLYETIKQHGLDVIHAHYAIPHAAAAYLAKQMGGGKPPVVTTLHGTDITLVGSHAAYAPVVKFTIDSSDRATAVSQFLAETTCQRIGVTREIRVIPNFVCQTIYRRTERPVLRELLAPNGMPVLLHISNFRPVKRVHDLMHAFIEVRKHLRCRLLLVGDGPERARAEQIAQEAGVLEDVLCLGNQTEIVELLSIADVYCLPSETESFGLSALEAMACEVPVVASRVGGLPEVVADGETGYLFEMGNPKEMAERILQICGDPQRRREMGQAARERAITLFPQEKIVGEYEALYKEIV